MATGMNQQQLEHLAKLGARARLDEMQREKDAIYRAFPDLRAGGRGRQARQSQAGFAGGRETVEAAETPRRRQRSMSAAGRRAVSERMKRYWAGRRKEKAAKR